MNFFTKMFTWFLFIVASLCFIFNLDLKGIAALLMIIIQLELISYADKNRSNP